MKKYDGWLVHQEFDEHGLIEIVETQNVRSLHFGTSPQQSSMDITEPKRLHALYTKAMMSWLLFKEQPDNVLMIGLGGGLLTKYLLYQFPECQIKTIEFRPAIIKVARRFFQLPLEPRLKIKIGDGAEYIKQQSKFAPAQHDLIMIDAFDEWGMADTMQGTPLFSACKTLLSNQGILVVNLWANDKQLFSQIAWEMRSIFAWKILFLPVRKRENIIVLAFAEGHPSFFMKTLRNRAKQLDEQYQIEFLNFIKDLKRNNSRVLKRVIKS
jgi:spermidine synthase